MKPFNITKKKWMLLKRFYLTRDYSQKLHMGNRHAKTADRYNLNASTKNPVTHIHDRMVAVLFDAVTMTKIEKRSRRS